MAHASLGIAEENSGKLVTLIRQQGKKLAEEKNLDLLLTDGPPGIGCPVIASLGGATAVLIVTEPTVSGRHDMERVAELAAFFKVPAMVCVNKFDLNPDQGQGIEEFARQRGIRVMGRIPFDPVFTKAMVQGKTILEYDRHSGGAEAVKKIWQELVQGLGIG
jgi:MinD superfamily P-loop ATPase